ncbi:MAG: Gfo/Idh/MocA family oxidoreductase [Bacillota bacterium]
MENRIKVGVIGVGSMGINHVRSYASLKHICDLVGLYDTDRKKADDIAQSYGVKSFSSLENLLKEVDAVNIATPTSTHYDIAVESVKKGIHILIEKPITSEVEQAEEILSMARDKNLTVQVGHIERFNPAIQALPGILEDEKIIALDVQRMGPYDPRINDTDVIQDLMIHDIDVVNSLIEGDIKDVQGFGRVVESEKMIDYAVANMLMSNGVIATLTASRATHKKVRKLSITTMKSYVELDYMQRKVIVTRRGGLVHDNNYQQENELEEIFSDEEEPLKAQLKHFICAVKNDTRPLINGSDGLEALRLTKKIQNQIYRKD